MTKAKFYNVRFGDAQVEYMKILCKRLGLNFDDRGVRSEVIHFALRVAACGYVQEQEEVEQE